MPIKKLKNPKLPAKTYKRDTNKDIDINKKALNSLLAKNGTTKDESKIIVAARRRKNYILKTGQINNIKCFLIQDDKEKKSEPILIPNGFKVAVLHDFLLWTVETVINEKNQRVYRFLSVDKDGNELTAGYEDAWDYCPWAALQKTYTIFDRAFNRSFNAKELLGVESGAAQTFLRNSIDSIVISDECKDLLELWLKNESLAPTLARAPSKKIISSSAGAAPTSSDAKRIKTDKHESHNTAEPPVSQSLFNLSNSSTLPVALNTPSFLIDELRQFKQQLSLSEQLVLLRRQTPNYSFDSQYASLSNLASPAFKTNGQEGNQAQSAQNLNAYRSAPLLFSAPQQLPEPDAKTEMAATVQKLNAELNDCNQAIERFLAAKQKVEETTNKVNKLIKVDNAGLLIAIAAATKKNKELEEQLRELYSQSSNAARAKLI